MATDFKKRQSYRDVGYDAFLNRGPGARGKEIETLGDITSGKKSALNQSSTTEQLNLGSSGSLSLGDGKTTRLFIGFRGGA